MLRRGAYKYVAYAGYESQVFNLEDDPEEIDNLHQNEPELALKMDQELRKLVDYNAVDYKVKQYDRDSYVAWRAEIGEEAYEQAMSEILPGWSDVERTMTETWLSGK